MIRTIIVIFKNNKVLKITITTRGGESKQTHSHRRDATQNRIIFDDGYTKSEFGKNISRRCHLTTSNCGKAFSGNIM